MKTLYIECNMGAAGDMLMSALVELLPSPDDFIKKLNNLNIPNVEFKKNKSVKCGITGTHIDVLVSGVTEDEHIHEHHDRHEKNDHHQHSHAHHHTGMKEIEHIIGHINVSDRVREDALAVYRLIAEAESHAHGCEVEQIHFHEVGSMDAVADIVGTCMLVEEITPDRIIVSPVHVGSGQVKCAHGILPVPAPATAYILRDIPIYSSGLAGELCTPTGAALLRYFAAEFAPMPVMSISKIGYGMGTKDFDTANCLRVMLGEAQGEIDTVSELCCNIDDMTGEGIGFAVDRLFEAGALDVFTTPVGMKKNRPGVLLTCLCHEERKNDMVKLIFKHTSTIGIREHVSKRYVLSRTEDIAHTKYGDIRIKKSYGYGVSRAKPEYDDVEKAAKENDVSIVKAASSITNV